MIPPSIDVSRTNNRARVSDDYFRVNIYLFGHYLLSQDAVVPKTVK